MNTNSSNPAAIEGYKYRLQGQWSHKVVLIFFIWILYAYGHLVGCVNVALDFLQNQVLCLLW